MEIIEPFHGAVLNHRNGLAGQDCLTIPVRVAAGADDNVLVNGAAARRAGAEFQAEVALREKETDIVAVADGPGGRRERRVRVVWDRHSRPRYRFAVDDNIYFLRDLAARGCRSLFDCPYLEMFRRFHETYAAKFVLNLFHRTREGDFDLTRFPDRYRGQWADNAHWLKLAFHAYQEFPGRPYQDADPAKLLADLDEVAEQVVRFAGEEAYSPTTVIHFAMIRPEAVKHLARRGVRALSTHLHRTEGGWDINYQLDDARSRYLLAHDALRDFESGVTFSNIDVVCNETPPEQVAPVLERVAADANTAEIIDLLTHEQYFWPFYQNYLPDHAERVEAAIRWVTQRGYEPVFFHEGLLGGREWD